jgi:hypothetical protein
MAKSEIVMCHSSYLAWHADAEQRYRRGERQLYCDKDHGDGRGSWRWPDECAHEGRLTGRQFLAMVTRAKREVARKYPSQEAQYRKRVAAGEETP